MIVGVDGPLAGSSGEDDCFPNHQVIFLLTAAGSHLLATANLLVSFLRQDNEAGVNGLGPTLPSSNLEGARALLCIETEALVGSFTE